MPFLHALGRLRTLFGTTHGLSIHELSLLKDTVCFNQGEYVSYSYYAHKLHTTLKDTIGRSPSPSFLTSSIDELDSFLNTNLEKAMRRNFVYLEDLFRAGSANNNAPRICIKGNFDSEKRLISDLFRHKATYRISPFPITDNTGFVEVANNGATWFMCNNLPVLAKSGYYYNPRLIPDRVALYKPPGLLSNRNDQDVEWEKCWRPYESGTRTPPESCYKSTAIIPIMFRENKLTFLGGSYESKGVIFGYLCFDSTHTNYFTEKKHKRLGYIIADIVSLYFFRRWTLTVHSTSYQKARGRIAQQAA